MNMSIQDETSFLRLASVAAASEKYFEYVQPPSENTIFNFGFFIFSFLSWLNVPTMGWLNVSPTPSTLMSGPKLFWKSANASPAPSPAFGSFSLPASDALVASKQVRLVGSMFSKS